VNGLDPDAPLRGNAALILETRLDELRSLAATALEPSASTAQHDTRIAAKRLRYLLEIVGGCFGDEAEVAHDAAKQLQGVLGDLHDCDVMLPLAAGIEPLETLLRSRRDRHFQQFEELWRVAGEKGTWVALLRRLRS
jgi:CHAD domain-containing protein